MEAIDEVEQQISRLYYDNIDTDQAVELMRGQNVSAELVKAIYDQLSADIEKWRERFNYYTIGSDSGNDFDIVSCWTSRYLLGYHHESPDPDFHEIKIIDVFNDKSM
jgi:hypothetical protein